MKFSVLTLFPEIIALYARTSIVGRAQSAGIISVDSVDFRTFSADPNRKVDDSPYGGGSGMVLACQPVVDAWASLQPMAAKSKTIVLTPTGIPLTHNLAKAFSEDYQQLVLLCGHYEGFDQRIFELIPDVLPVSLGDFVLTGGELAALSVIDAVTRLLPGAVQKFSSVEADSFYNTLLDHPHYTRPANFRGHEVPAVLRSGDHQKIAAWRKEQALAITRHYRPDLLNQSNRSASIVHTETGVSEKDSQESSQNNPAHSPDFDAAQLGIHPFVTRQTPESHHAHFNGSWDALLALTKKYWKNRVPSPNNPLVFLVPLPEAACEQFFTATVSLEQIKPALDQGTLKLVAAYKTRTSPQNNTNNTTKSENSSKKEEAPCLQVFATPAADLKRPHSDESRSTDTKQPVPQKQKASRVDIVLYHHDILAADNDAPEPKIADFYIISVNASPSQSPEPMNPMTMARNQLHLPGGTKPKTPYSSEEYARAVYFWSQHVKFHPAQ
ncbi:MAG: tRNA (guanosine(37)-N1)-methyltransferase TrmD [Cyanobacteria bacterium P01_H01_bin.74]